MAQENQISAAERSYRILYRKIISLELKPNEAVGEQMLAEMLSVSRTPVREALSRLSVEGLVDLRARSGVVISPIRYEAVRTAQYVREKLEMAVIADAAGRTDKRVLLGIRQAIEEQELAISEGVAEHFFEADERMHFMFCGLADREGVWAVIADAKKHMDRVRRLSVQTGHLDLLLQDHLALLAAVSEGNAASAQEIMRLHLRRVMSDLRELAKRFPDYFEPEIADLEFRDSDSVIA
ncbi:GntR family transcriptional regulator [Devosia epidermidihirudinis]|uniref:GntR family transcriptional regulator n=1 Tax=Devosia epidermidihirudinis TaxID=1293439 RepID=A0A0F5Q309_9HYPH|nr:GntR family transcriptional regulator [Devosia epidermidihirudinis]KKC35303.1 GntR family transcriptional regulator [Devosia epidermidihirudinis]